MVVRCVACLNRAREPETMDEQGMGSDEREDGTDQEAAGVVAAGQGARGCSFGADDATRAGVRAHGEVAEVVRWTGRYGAHNSKG